MQRNALAASDGAKQKETPNIKLGALGFNPSFTFKINQKRGGLVCKIENFQNFLTPLLTTTYSNSSSEK
jgi:hypothetical protein